jgi:hypothetical protein
MPKKANSSHTDNRLWGLRDTKDTRRTSDGQIPMADFSKSVDPHGYMETQRYRWNIVRQMLEDEKLRKVEAQALFYSRCVYQFRIGKKAKLRMVYNAARI